MFLYFAFSRGGGGGGGSKIKITRMPVDSLRGGVGCKSHVGCSGFPPKKLKKEIILLEVDRKEITVATFKSW